MSRHLIIEGGSSKGGAQQRQGFVDFLRRAGVREQPRIKLAGSRNSAIQTYLAHESGTASLLVDSEEPVKDASSVAHLLATRAATREQATRMHVNEVFLMIETMESWLIADIESIKSRHPLVDSSDIEKVRARVANNVERIPKAEAERLLSNAFPSGRLDSKAARLGLVGSLDPDRVRSSSAEAARFLKAMAGQATR